MKKIVTKRVSVGDTIFHYEFNAQLSDYDILCLMFNPNKNYWVGNSLYCRKGEYEVWEHIEYQEQWFDRLKRKIEKRFMTYTP